ncbi:MAG: NUDIX domain-containing protein, partial [Phycisphaerales bacterium]|nr:NUDIX domain-containing protein [Phycisphaerales bacterium]
MAKKKVSTRRISTTRAARSTRSTQGSRPKPEPKAAAKPSRPKPTPAKKLGNTTEPAAIEFIARGVLIAGSRVLLCRNLKHDYLYLPGGHVEFGESAAAALAREFLEEAALPVRVGPLALVSEGTFATKRRGHHEVNLVFHVEQTGGR